ncbi:hypothetical protein MB02_12340 [Croceicoccus estronivorus]|nr:hypothetical protein MB02_12340 [Croceicoccus estronivorus]
MKSRCYDIEKRPDYSDPLWSCKIIKLLVRQQPYRMVLSSRMRNRCNAGEREIAAEGSQAMAMHQIEHPVSHIGAMALWSIYWNAHAVPS